MFIDGSCLTIRSGARVFLERELETRLTTLAQYFHTFLDPQHGQVEELQTAP